MDNILPQIRTHSFEDHRGKFLLVDTWIPIERAALMWLVYYRRDFIFRYEDDVYKVILETILRDIKNIENSYKINQEALEMGTLKTYAARKIK
jgi:hypothetical protein